MRHTLVSPVLKPGSWARRFAHQAVVSALALAAATGVLRGQGGLRIRDISGFGNYYSSTLPGGSIPTQNVASQLGSDGSVGGSVVFDWTRFTERTTFALNYTPSYLARVRYSSLNSLNHAFSLNATRAFARWKLGLGLGADLSTVEQSLFLPTALSNLAAVPATISDLAAGALSPGSGNPQLTNTLNSAPLVDSAVRSLLYGQKTLTSSGQVTLSYAYSPRLGFSFGGGAGRTQTLSSEQNVETALISNTTSVSARAAFSYALSPLTQIGASSTALRVSSTIEDIYTTNSFVTLGRSFGQRWLVQLRGGVGISTVRRQLIISKLPTRPGPVAGGGLVYKTFAYSFLASFDRTVSDSFGAGAATNTSIDGSWRWKRPGNDWSIETTGGWQQLSGNIFNNTSAWRGSVGVGRMFGAQLSLLTQYSYLRYSGTVVQTVYDRSQSAVRVSLVWSPKFKIAQ